MHRCNQNSGHSVMVVHHVLVGYHCHNIGVMYKLLLVAISLDLATLVHENVTRFEKTLLMGFFVKIEFDVSLPQN